MTELKTQKTDKSVTEFLARIDDTQRRQDCQVIAELMEDITKAKPAMWGNSIVGFGEYTYRYASGHSGTWMQVGFSPRKQYLTLYLMGLHAIQPALLDKLGPHKTGKGCLYLKDLRGIDMTVLRELIRQSVQNLS